MSFLNHLKDSKLLYFLAISITLAIMSNLTRSNFKTLSFVLSVSIALFSLFFSFSMFKKSGSNSVIATIPTFSILYFANSTIVFSEDFLTQNFFSNHYIEISIFFSFFALLFLFICLIFYIKKIFIAISFLSICQSLVAFFKNSIVTTTIIITCSGLASSHPGNSSLQIFTILFPLVSQFLIYWETLFGLIEKVRKNSQAIQKIQTFKAFKKLKNHIKKTNSFSYRHFKNIKIKNKPYSSH